MSVRYIPEGKGAWCVRMTTSPPLRAECYEIWKPKPPGTLWATPGPLGDSFTKLYIYNFVRETIKKDKYWKRFLTVEKPLKSLKYQNVMRLIELNKLKCGSWGIVL
jgi:hypothetical protein